MRQLTIDWYALEAAFDDDDEFGTDRANYLDVETGEVVFVDEEISSTVGLIIDELQESLGEADWTDEVFRETDAFQQLSKEEQPSVLAAMKIDYGDSNQFARVPTFESHESYEWMRDFIETVDDDGPRNRLSDAISQRKPFRRFRDVLAGDRRLEQQWREFEATRRRDVIIDWLHSIGVEPANPDSSMYNPPPLPDLRNIMFAEVRRFVRFARDIEGIQRIALIGSLATDKEFPKDIDLLVTVSGDCDLGPLAKLARQLSGHMNSHRAGADVFLASEDGEYLGRLCPWRDCGPGFRASCDAMHCGLRPFLHDDFDSVRLKKDIITHPPVLLWPNPAAKQGVVADVHEQLIKQMAEDEVR
jgi:predicted nucleotidyltransferase